MQSSQGAAVEIYIFFRYLCGRNSLKENIQNNNKSFIQEAGMKNRSSFTCYRIQPKKKKFKFSEVNISIKNYFGNIPSIKILFLFLCYIINVLVWFSINAVFFKQSPFFVFGVFLKVKYLDYDNFFKPSLIHYYVKCKVHFYLSKEFRSIWARFDQISCFE